MKHSNISIFIPHVGCPHLCSFCDQRTISGAERPPTGDEVREICRSAAEQVTPKDSEIAFFGGSFTAIPRDYMITLLEAAWEFVGSGKFSGVRISTRPDYIDSEVLSLLKKYGVTAIELGAQSMDDDVLDANERGHNAADVTRACELIRSNGFELGLQMMTGLYKSSVQSDAETAQKLIALRPDTVRIYPVVVLKGTRLAQLFNSGEYELPPFDEMVKLCGTLIRRFEDEHIRVIKCGLHASEFVKRDMVAGYYHPAFRELCESAVYREVIMKKIAESNIPHGALTVTVGEKYVSRAVGHKRANPEYFRDEGFDIRIKGSSDIPMFDCRIGDFSHR